MKNKNNIVYGILEERYLKNKVSYLVKQHYTLAEAYGWQDAKQFVNDIYQGMAANPLEFTQRYFANLFSDPETYHSAAAFSGTIPVYGDALSIADSALYMAQGDTESAKLALLSSIPFIGAPADANRVMKAVAKLDTIPSKLDNLPKSTLVLPDNPKTVPTTIPDWQAPKPQLPGSKPIEIEPQFDPNRPFWKPGQKSPEPYSPPPIPEIPAPKPSFPRRAPRIPLPDMPEEEKNLGTDPISSTGIEPSEFEASPRVEGETGMQIQAYPKPDFMRAILSNLKLATSLKKEEDEEDDTPDYGSEMQNIDFKNELKNVEPDASAKKIDVDLQQTKLGKYSGSYRVK
jgi:hypothetical protein